MKILSRFTGKVMIELEYRNERLVTNLRDANLRGANLRGANLIDANLEGANLEDANLEGAKLEYANLRDAHLRGANLTDANLEGANLEDANLRGANLRGANLIDANLEGAKLEYANLRDAHLRGANLIDANLEGAKNGDFTYSKRALTINLHFWVLCTKKWTKIGCITKTNDEWLKILPRLIELNDYYEQENCGENYEQDSIRPDLPIIVEMIKRIEKDVD